MTPAVNLLRTIARLSLADTGYTTALWLTVWLALLGGICAIALSGTGPYDASILGPDAECWSATAVCW